MKDTFRGVLFHFSGCIDRCGGVNKEMLEGNLEGYCSIVINQWAACEPKNARQIQPKAKKYKP